MQLKDSVYTHIVFVYRRYPCIYKNAFVQDLCMRYCFCTYFQAKRRKKYFLEICDDSKLFSFADGNIDNISIQKWIQNLDWLKLAFLEIVFSTFQLYCTNLICQDPFHIPILCVFFIRDAKSYKITQSSNKFW